MPQRQLEDVIGLNDPNSSVMLVLQRLCRLVEARLGSLESKDSLFEDLMASLRDVAISRMNEVLLPAFQAISEMASLGVMFNAHSTTPVVLGTGFKIFQLTEDDRVRFSYSTFMTAVSASNESNAMVGRYTSYERTTGQLTMSVYIAVGDGGSHNDWIITPAPAPFIAATVIDPGDDVTQGTGGPHVYEVTW